MSKGSFSSLSLSELMLENLDSLGYLEMTEVQEKSLPWMLGGRDVLARAKTGSGKTAAFGLQILERLDVGRVEVQALVLCPTRELAEQVGNELRRLARRIHNVKILTLCGGRPINPQINSLSHGAHVVVGTPGRIIRHLDGEALPLGGVEVLVLDEADRMLDMGFAKDIEKILGFCPKTRQTLLFSATYPDDILKMSGEIQDDPVEVIVGESEVNEDIEQTIYWVDGEEEKFEVLRRLLLSTAPASALIFCNRIDQTRDLGERLYEAGLSVLSIHGDLEQRMRDEVLTRFSNGSVQVLVATDVAARGLDIEGLELVVVYDLSFDREVHIHRVGRTGRAGSKGVAVSLVTKEVEDRLKGIERLMGGALKRGDAEELRTEGKEPLIPKMLTFEIDAGKKMKVRPGDILGALTKDAGISGEFIGKISIFQFYSYVAVDRRVVGQVQRYFRDGKIKGRRFRVERLD